MIERKLHLHDGKKGSALAIRVTPRSDQNRVVEILPDGSVKVHLKIESFGQNMNEILLTYLAEIFEISRDRLEIVAGATGRDKLVSILDMEANTLQEKLHHMIN